MLKLFYLNTQFKNLCQKETKAMIDLSNIKKYTILYNIHYPNYKNMRLGTSILSGFLKTLGYNKIKILDIPFLPELRLKLKEETTLNIILNTFIEMDINSIPEFYKTTINYSNQKPDIVGFSLMGGLDLAVAISYAKIIKSLNKNVFIVWGGALVSVHIETLLQANGLSRYIDGLITGYGEKPLAHLIKNLNVGKSLDAVPNLFYSSEGTQFKKPLSLCSPNPIYLRTVPDFSNFYGAAALPIRLSMGCYWGKCAFCIYRRTMMQNIRYNCLTPREAVSLVKEYIKRYNIKWFSFLDDGPHPKFLKEFCQLVIAEKLAIQWDTFLCLDKAFIDPKLTKLLESAGCQEVALGLESIVDTTLIKMHKMQKPEQVRPILESFKTTGIRVILNIIIGFPSETREEFQKTIDFILDNKNLYYDVLFFPYEMDKNDDIYSNPEDYQIDFIDKDEYYIRIYGENSYKKEQSVGYKYKVKSGITQEEASDLVKYYNRLKNIIFTLIGQANIKQKILESDLSMQEKNGLLRVLNSSSK